MTRLLVIAAAIASVFATAGSAQATNPCPSVQWTANPAIVEVNETVLEIASIDYDEDGRLDLVGVASQSGGYRPHLVWWKGEGDGTFRTQAQTSFGATFRENFSNIVIADVTGDGLSDIVTTLKYEDPPRLVILPATGSGRGPALIKTIGRAGVLTAIQRDDDPAVELVLRSFDSRSFEVYDDIAATPTLALSVETEMTPTGIAGADFDGDGNPDLAVAMEQLDEAALQIYYGRADGTLETPVALPSIRPRSLAVGDLNEDGRPDLIAANQDEAATVSIYLNEGGRNFLATGVSLAKYGAWGTVMLADVSGDGHLDLIAGETSAIVATAVGRGDGTFLMPTFGHVRSFGRRAAGDFDGDGKLELAAGFWDLSLVTATCATQVSLGTPTTIRYVNSMFLEAIPRGQQLELHVEISGFGPPRRPGSVILRDGATVLDSAPAGADGTASFIVPDLANGHHLLTAEFTGNRTVPAATSLALDQWVTDPTPVAIRLPDPLPVYGEPLPIQVIVASGGTSEVTLDIDGASQSFWTDDPIHLSLEPASHTVTAKFAGGYTAAPGQSPPVTFTISKGTPALEINSAPSLRESVQALAFSVKGIGAVGPRGSVQLIEGTTTIASGALVNGSASVNVALSRGIHEIRAVYSGDTRYREVSRDLTFEVLQNLPFPIAAHAMADGIRIAYVLPLFGMKETLQLFRRPAGSMAWEVVPGWNPDTGMDANVPRRGVTYEYRLYVQHTNAYRSFSNIDSAALSARRRAVSPP